jgi:hypothetical protein
MEWDVRGRRSSTDEQYENMSVLTRTAHGTRIRFVAADDF